MIKTSSTFAVLFGGLIAASVAQAQLPVSRRAAIVPVPLSANSTTSVGIPFIQEPVARDLVTGVSGNTITGAGAYTPGAYATGYQLLIVTGPGRGTGLPISNNTASDFTVVGPVPALTANSDEFELVSFNTLASVFGNPPTTLTGGSSAAAADKVVIGSSQYFYKTSGAASPGWKLTTAPNGGNVSTTVPIPNLAGVNIIRVGAATDVAVRGVARSTRAVVPIPTGTSLVSWPFTGNVMLLESGLQNSILGASSAAGADKVVIGGTQYFYKTSGANSPGWKTTTLPNAAAPGANNVVLNPSGKAFNIIRAGAATSHPVLESFAP